MLLLAQVFGSGPGRAGGPIGLAVVGLLFALGVSACARGVAGSRQWARAPAITWQLLQGFVALPSLRGGFWYIGAPLLLMSVVTVLLLIRPGVIPPR